MLFAPKYAEDGYIIPFYVTLVCVLTAFVGYLGFRALVVAENHRRTRIVADWNDDEVRHEVVFGDSAIEEKGFRAFLVGVCRFNDLRDWAGVDKQRRGDEKLTFLYSL
jgi:hypothetical protein